MKSVTYRRDWGSNTSEAEEMEEKFGKLLVEFDKSEPYETEVSSLFYNKKTRKYTWIDANGCSCWDGDWDGWELTKTELKQLAEKAVANRYSWRDTAEYLVGAWVMEHRK